ncbi:peptide chain release factor N(5)-glutamine methyltransferase [Corynebacterium cystitidis]|uniref:peptide chain release factor N(5)-glutamine methyltransferase n=1 Tax=Corynebacterium cystitidis TaxID=35757 RepID=UPI0014756075|nr:peptide chain release factor N(5)-glutamine methyltransferase [Corynebacterium cystitidis]
MKDLLEDATSRLKAAGVDSPEADAQWLAAELLGVRPLQLRQVESVPSEFFKKFEQWVSRREAREPLQHIVGSAPFGPLELAVGPGVFIPRPETESLADWAVGRIALADEPVVVDLGTGSGALALYIAHARPDARVYAVEKSRQACDYAQRNADSIGVDITLVEGDMTDPDLLAELHGTVDLVVTNPPYVPESESLQREVYADPPEAVFAGIDGMSVIRDLVPVAGFLLASGGGLGIEHDDATSAEVQEAVVKHGGFEAPESMTDLTGRDRFVITSKLAQE